MNGPIAQIAALVCHGNAYLAKRERPNFFPANSTCKFCESIIFTEPRRRLFWVHEDDVIKTPDAWITKQPGRAVIGLRMFCKPQNDPRISERMTAGLVGGGGTWVLEAICRGGQSEFWVPTWQIGDQKAPDQRIWRVRYKLVAKEPNNTSKTRDIATVKNEFKSCLEAVLDFSRMSTEGSFTKCFADALTALDNPDSDIGYHKDISPPGHLTPIATSMLKASMSAWVFGGMGSWNDLGFEPTAQSQYEKVSDDLFRVIKEVVTVATSHAAA